MEFIVIFVLIVGAVWLVWRIRSSEKASEKAALEEAWDLVLEDPNYDHRRRYEERKRAEEARARKEEGIKR